MTAAHGVTGHGATMTAVPVEPAASVGSRLRALRQAAGLSQSELAAGRFSKEYVSQLERGRTRPTVETLDWLAGRLNTDRAFLEHGLSEADAARAEALLDAAQALARTHRYAEAAAGFREARVLAAELGSPALVVRALRGEAWSEVRRGGVEEARTALSYAENAAASPGVTAVDRADLVFLAGVCDYTVSEIDDALVTFGRALELAEGSGLACDRLRSDIFQWRSRCYRRVRDWPAAREDVERALELADARADPLLAADALFQASLVAQREGMWALARRRGEEARALYAEIGDHTNDARMLNNIAGLNHLLGDPDTAIAQLKEAFEAFVDLHLAAEAGYVLSSLADIHLDMGDHGLAEAQARKALALLGDRVDHLQEIGTARLALGRSLLGQGRVAEAEAELDEADATFTRAASVSHQADSWIARGDLAKRTGDDHQAARLYKQAAETLLAANT
jgi:tetratricopeptide (TPR) repeat protein